MINARLLLGSLAVLVFASQAHAKHYRLRPVHHDPSHALQVEERMKMAHPYLSLPEEYQIPKDRLPAVRDQGERGSCVYFATVGLLETYYNAKHSDDDPIRLSEECLVDVRNWMYDQGSDYTGDDRPDQRPDDNGDLPRSVIKTVERNGVPKAKKYKNPKVECRYNGNAGRAVSMEKYLSTFGTGKSDTYGKSIGFDIDLAPTIDGIKAMIASGHPVEVGILVYNWFFNRSDWKYDPSRDRDRDIAGEHAVILTGYKMKNGHTIFTFKNSWGTSWGSRGYGTIQDDLLTHGWSYDATLDDVESLHD